MTNAEIIISDLQKIIDWYGQSGSTATIEDLLKWKDKTCVKCWYLAEIAADMKNQYNKSRFVKKIHVGRKKMEFIGKGAKVNAAEIEADVSAADLYEDEMSKEALAYRLDKLYDAAGNIIQAMQQRISHLKTESKQSMQAQHQ